LSSDTGGIGSTDEERMNETMEPSEMHEAPAQPVGVETTEQAGPQVEGRRTQLKIVRENIDSLSADVGNFRKSHEGSIKKLEKQLAELRRELAAQTVSRDVGSFRKSHEVSTKRLENQVATLRRELAALKSSIANDTARARAKQEVMLARILAKVTPKSSKRAKASKKSKPAKSSKKR
jgi:hypothetical protein